MDAKQLKGRLRRKIIMHMLFQIGGAVVIVGALFKILHLEIGPITGGVVLGLGLGTEAIIFLVGGLMLDDVREEQDEYVSKHAGGGASPDAGGDEETLSSKIDGILKEDKLIIEDLIVAAHNNAKAQLKIKTSEEISKTTGGFGIPGFKWPL